MTIIDDYARLLEDEIEHHNKIMAKYDKRIAELEAKNARYKDAVLTAIKQFEELRALIDTAIKKK